MKNQIEVLLQQAIASLQAQNLLPETLNAAIAIERCRDPQHGDFATNLAMLLAKPAKQNPRALAEAIIAQLPSVDWLNKVEIAGPGFINFFIDAAQQFNVVPHILSAGSRFGLSTMGQGKRVQVEFVSANPTGPLHVGHGRGAAYGSAVADVLEAAGFEVEREYYVNDAGRQMDILGTSVWLRYLQLCGESFDFPSNGYRGDYVLDIANKLQAQAASAYHHPAQAVFADIPADEPQGGDKEKHIDALIERAKNLLGADGYRAVFDLGLNDILDDIKDDLAQFGVSYQTWFSERSLMEDGSVQQALQRLQDAGHLYEKDGAIWFASSQLGDEKDRVVRRENGQYTYFASDIAYHMNKLDRGFDQIVNVWGADHHGYIPRVKAAIQALGADPAKLNVLLVQFAVLYRGEEKVQMSTRSGEFVTLRELRDEVGSDACRFFYVMRKSEQHMDFDLQLATSQSNENPVYYVQYAHARVCSVFRKLNEAQRRYDQELGLANLPLLTAEHETALLTTLSKYPEIVQRAAQYYEPHQLIHYLRDLANQFHSYYNAHAFLVEDEPLCQARLTLISAVKQVLINALNLLKINAPESM